MGVEERKRNARKREERNGVESGGEDKVGEKMRGEEMRSNGRNKERNRGEHNGRGGEAMTKEGSGGGAWGMCGRR